MDVPVVILVVPGMSIDTIVSPLMLDGPSTKADVVVESTLFGGALPIALTFDVKL